MSDHKPLSCGLYDYIEIFCLYHYKIDILNINDEHIIAIAKDVKEIQSRECLILDGNEIIAYVALDEIKRISVLTPNAKYDTVDFI